MERSVGSGGCCGSEFIVLNYLIKAAAIDFLCIFRDRIASGSLLQVLDLLCWDHFGGKSRLILPSVIVPTVLGVPTLCLF